MWDKWMRLHKFPLSLEEFHRLPRNPAYKYEYLAGKAWLTPRPKTFHGLLDLERFAASPAPEDAPAPPLRSVEAADWDALALLFAAAFRAVEPFSGLEDEPRRQASRECLEHTRTGGDGPWIEQASFVAPDERGKPAGAVLTTLTPPGDVSDWRAWEWAEPPPPDAVIRRLGRAHLTWIFVHPQRAGRGLGTTLLRAAVRELRVLGYTELASTFLLGNDSSMLWHWRNGFQLTASPWSLRRPR